MRVNIDSSLLINSHLRGWWRGHMGACGWTRMSSESSSSGSRRPSEAAGECHRWRQQKLMTSCFGIVCDGFDETMTETLLVVHSSWTYTEFLQQQNSNDFYYHFTSNPWAEEKGGCCIGQQTGSWGVLTPQVIATHKIQEKGTTEQKTVKIRWNVNVLHALINVPLYL